MPRCEFCGEGVNLFRALLATNRNHPECAARQARQDAEAKLAEARRREERDAQRRAALLGDARDLVKIAVAGKAGNEGGRLPFNLMKSESLISVERGVPYHKYVKQRSHRTTGASIRVAKGVWIRQNAGRSRPDDQLEHVDTGVFGLTTKHVYFAGANQRFRVRLDKLVTHQAWEDAVSVTRDNATAQPEFFGVREPEKTAALLTAAYEAM